MDRAAEWFVLLTALPVGLSHLFRPGDWQAAYAALHRLGRPGAFANGGLSLFPGAALVAAHPAWAGPGVVVTALGWLMVLKGAGCLLSPDKALRSMAAGAGSGRWFQVGGVILLAVGVAAGWALWGGWN
ncbi:MAG: hypothetical protein K2X82_21800 [Gemmataceae bacterium]|nr:hypothetical protein [Gemmataceae bacterium]